MKKIILLFFITFSFIGCSKDDDSQVVTPVAIEGKWQFSKEGELINGQEVLTNYQHSAGCIKDFSEILAGGVIKDHYFNSSCTESIDVGTWVRNNNNLTFTYPGNSATYLEIMELTATTLKVKYVNAGTTYISVLTRI
ncbi:lipocalin family protein [Flavobacterium sp.]|uniref:lipocalin family protein n=1 Tax=Flavobacterium sp. TaxID=239 RepID=UPI00262B9F21|nr:lipocalin family protein [Flavobacterium sp.]